MPVWMFLVSNNLYNHPREPTAEEQEAETYGVVISGCSGLKYFYGQPVGRKHWQKFLQLNRELEELTPIISSPEPVPQLHANRPILTLTRKYEGRIYILAVNISSTAQELHLDLSKLLRHKPLSARSLFDDPTPGLSGFVLADTLPPLTRRVYEITP